MLLIACPYCGMERPEIEFRYGGEAHIARPADPRALSDEEWANFLYFRSNPKGAASPSAGATAFGCGRFFNCLRDTVSDKILATYKAGEPRPDVAADAGQAERMSQPFRVAGVGSIDRSRPLRFTFDGVAYQGYAGDTLASALLANGVHLVGRSYKYHRPRGILPPAPRSRTRSSAVARGPGRFTPNLRATQVELYDGLERVEPEPLALAHVRRRRGQRPAVAVVRRRLLLQDLHGPEPARQELGLDAYLRAGDPPRRGSRRGSARARSRPLSAHRSPIATC